MKKWLLLGFAVMGLVLIAFLGQPAVNPEDFTGDWYSTDGQNIYRFQNGIIYCDKHHLSFRDGSIFSGAYVFSGKSVVLFTMGVEGLETEQKLYLVENKGEFLLCDQPSGAGTIYFVRSK